MATQITMRRTVFEGGSIRDAGATYTVEDTLAQTWIALGWAVRGTIYGDQFSSLLAAPARATGNPSLVVVSSPIGFQLVQATTPTLAAGDILVLAWSTTENDSSNLGIALDSVCDQAEAASPSGAPVSNTKILTAANQWTGAAWDGVARIKSLAAVVAKLGAATGGTAQRLVLDITY